MYTIELPFPQHLAMAASLIFIMLLQHISLRGLYAYRLQYANT